MQRLPIPDKTKITEVQKNRSYHVTSCCMQGWRTTMEDAHCIILEAANDNSCAFFCICDGHSGRSAADFTSQNLHNYILRRPEYSQGDIQRGIYKGFLQLDREMRRNEFVRREQAGTTACAILIKGNQANVGDSRAIALVNDTVMSLSTDHTLSLPEEANRVRAAGYSIRHNRIDGVLAVSRCLGDYMFKSNISLPPERQAVSCAPDVRIWDLNSSWKFIFLASDGIFENISSEAVALFIQEQLADMKKPEEILELMLELCCSQTAYGYGTDNMTAILILFIDSLPLEYRLHTLEPKPLEPPKEEKNKRDFTPSPSKKYVTPRKGKKKPPIATKQELLSGSK